jgi:hypothetical protein
MNSHVFNSQVSLLYHFKALQNRYHLTIASIGRALSFFTIIVFDFNSSGKSKGKS